MVGYVGVLTALAAAPPVFTYKYENEDGIIVMSSAIPPNLAYKGYTVMNQDGTVHNIVPRQLSPKEIEERDRKQAEEDAAKQAGEARKRKDAELLKLSASTADVKDARDRKLRSIDGAIATTKANIVRLRQQKQHLEEQAADRERQGLLPSPEILQNLEILSTQITDKDHEVEMRQLEQLQVTEQFQMDLDRVGELLGTPKVAPDPTPDPAKKPGQTAVRNSAPDKIIQ
jgi:hypothetical protein